MDIEAILHEYTQMMKKKGTLKSQKTFKSEPTMEKTESVGTDKPKLLAAPSTDSQTVA